MKLFTTLIILLFSSVTSMAATANKLSPDAQAYIQASKRQPPGDISDILEPIRKQYKLPAIAAVVTTGERLVEVGVCGNRVWGENTPALITDPFHLGSDTKSMTATLAAILIQQHKLRWNTTLQQAFPELDISMLPAYRNVTVQDLMQQRSGFSADSALPNLSILQQYMLPGSPMQQREVYVEHILEDPPVNVPGTTFVYSNRNYAVLGHLLEVITHTPWEKLIKKLLFDPLGMDSAGFGPMAKMNTKDAPWEYYLQNGHHKAVPPGPYADNPDTIAPAGKVHCSVEDWAKYIALHLRGEEGKNGLLPADIIKKLHTAPKGSIYADGWVVLTRVWADGEALWHNGSNNLNYSEVWMAPKRDFAVLVMMNQGGTEAAAAADAVATKLIIQYIHSLKVKPH